MTLDQLDKSLREWQARSDAATASLLALRALPSYELLSSVGPSAGPGGLHLAGVTAQRLPPAMATLDKVWLDYGLLSSTVQRAVSLRAQMPRFSGVQQKIDEIDTLLRAPCIVREEPADLTRRDLTQTGSGRRPLTLQQLFDEMNSAFIGARDCVMDADACWKHLDAGLTPAWAFVEQHRGETAAGIPQLRRLIEALKPRVMADPLGARASFDREIFPLLGPARAAIEKLTAQRREFAGNLTATRGLLDKLAGIRGENEQAYAENSGKVSGCAPAELPLPAQRITQWSERLARIGKETDVDSACAELEHCAGEIVRAIAAEEASLARNQAPLELRRELRGRLSALKAKAAARGRVEDPELREIAERANALLYARPTPMNEVAGLIGRYEAGLNRRAIQERD